MIDLDKNNKDEADIKDIKDIVECKNESTNILISSVAKIKEIIKSESFERITFIIVDEFMRALVRYIVLVFIILCVADYSWGTQVRCIASGSMEPTFRVGAFVRLDKYIPIENIEVGDTIAFKYNNEFITHRVESKVDTENGVVLHTKGDNNAESDNINITEDNYVGRVVILDNTVGPKIASKCGYLTDNFIDAKEAVVVNLAEGLTAVVIVGAITLIVTLLIHSALGYLIRAFITIRAIIPIIYGYFYGLNYRIEVAGHPLSTDEVTSALCIAMIVYAVILTVLKISTDNEYYETGIINRLRNKKREEKREEYF